MFAKLTTLTPLTELKLRKTAGTSNKSGDDVLTILTPGEQLLNLSDSPVSVDGLNWYQVTVKSSGQTGFVAEAVDGNMLVGLWTEPITSNGKDTKQIISEFANAHGIEPNVLLAVLQIESGGNAFNSFGKPVARFELHVFVNYLNESEKAQFNQYFEENGWQHHLANLGNGLEQFHGNQEKEYKVLELAKSINKEAAYKSASYGMAQLMGFNFKACGFNSAEELFNAFCLSEAEQALAFCRFLGNKLEPLRSKDFKTFASWYNGPGQVDRYAALMLQAYNNLNG